MADTTETGVVIGVFEDRKQVIKAIDALLKAGFNDEQLGFAARSPETPQTEGDEEPGPGPVRRGIVGGILGAADMLLVPFTGPADATAMLSGALPITEEAMERLPGTHHHSGQLSNQDTAGQRTQQTDAGEEQRTSILTGGMIGGVVGAVIALLVPEIGIAIAGGALAAVLGGGVLGGVAGGFLGAFTDIGVPKEQAHYYAGEVKAGRTVVTVKTADQQQETIDLLRKYGAHDVQAH